MKNMILIILKIIMNTNKDDWEGFESFPQQHAPPQIGKSSQTQIIPDIKIKITPNPKKSSSIAQNRKLINFKSKNYRKLQYLNTQQPKRQGQKKQSQIWREQRHASNYIERPVRKLSINQTKDEIIPIFRFLNPVQNGKLVYKSILSKSVQQYFSLLQNQQLRESWHTVQTYQGQEDELTFDSKFESGNLQSVRKNIKVGNDYHLYLTPDTNTKGHRQWFYFTLSSLKALKVKIFIHNFKKALSLFQSGMRPYGKKLQEGVQGWRPIGYNVKYLKQQVKQIDKRQKNVLKKQNPFYCLSFQLQIQTNCTYCLASCIPYTYSYLKQQISLLHTSSKNSLQCQESILCKSLAGLDIPLITINSQIQREQQEKNYIIINSRIHPGQTSSSWVVEGILQQLYTSERTQNAIKQAKIVVKIVPMLNPDGVYMGNYRTGVMGIDFNRLFLSGQSNFFPQIEGLRQLVRNCKVQGNVNLYIDLHGHSILPGCFIYGPDPIFSPASQLKNFENQLKTSKYFASKHSIFGQINSKTETSRVYFQTQEGIYSLTCENSLGLFYNDAEKIKKDQFRSEDWKKFGKDLILAILKEYQKKLPLNSNKIQMQNYFENNKSQSKDNFYDLSIDIKRFKTDSQDLQKHINFLNQMETEDIKHENQAKNSKTIPEQIQSLNDSDSQSQDLNPQKRQELFGLVKKVLEKRQINEQANNQAFKRQQNRNKEKKSVEKGQAFMNFKQYRFGYQQTTLADWHTRKRLLSIPRVLKSQKLNQSYIIRKAVPKPFSSQFIFQSIEANKKIKTQGRQQKQKKIITCLQYFNPAERNKEKEVIQHFFAKKN